jgi:uncharacterized phage protein (TIGR02218 family)
MRLFSDAFAGHIASGATTLATCWRLTRRDGAVLGFTDHDGTLQFEGTDFVPAHGLEGGEAAHKLGPQVDTAEVVGFIRAEAITEADIAMGRYDGAQVETWRVDWRDPETRALLRTATIGEILREDGVYRAELRSREETLNAVSGRLYQSLCDARLGDARCKVNLAAPENSAAATVAAIRDPHRLAVTGLSGFGPGWFAFGLAEWLDGPREGLRDRLVSHARIGGEDVLGFSAPVGESIAEGAALALTAGCDRRFATCREKFGNAVNFRGFPHVPGNDFVLRYPRAEDDLDGRALVR